MSQIIVGPDGVEIEFPDNMSDAEIGKAMRRLYPSPAAQATKQNFEAAAAAKTGAKRTVWERFVDDGEDVIKRSGLVSAARAAYVNPSMLVRDMIPVTKGLNPLNVITDTPMFKTAETAIALTAYLPWAPDRQKVRNDEIQRRVRFAEKSKNDPWNEADGGFLGKTAHGAAALAGTLAGTAVDPTSYITGGSSAVARIGTQAALAGGVDLIGQEFDKRAGIQSELNLEQSTMSALAGGVFQGGGEVLGAALKRLRVEKPVAAVADELGVDAPVEAHFKAELDADDLINQKPLSFRDMEPDPHATPEGYQWDLFDHARDADPNAPTPEKGTVLSVAPADLLKKVKKNFGDVADLVPPEKASAFVDWVKSGGQSSPDWIDFAALTQHPDKIEALHKMLTEMFDPAFKRAGQAPVTFENVVSRVKGFGVSVDDAIAAHASITGERGLSSSLHAMEVVSNTHLTKMAKALDDAERIMNAADTTEGQKADAFKAIVDSVQLATTFDAMLTGTKSEVARTLAFMRQTKDRSSMLANLDDYSRALFNKDLSLDDRRKLIESMRAAYKRDGSKGLRESIRAAKTMDWADYLDFWGKGAMLSSPNTIMNNFIGTAANAEFDMLFTGNLRALVGEIENLFSKDSFDGYSFGESWVRNRVYRATFARNVFNAGKALTNIPKVFDELGAYVQGTDIDTNGAVTSGGGIRAGFSKAVYAAGFLPNQKIDQLFRQASHQSSLAGVAFSRARDISRRSMKDSSRASREAAKAVFKEVYANIMAKPTLEAITQAKARFGDLDVRTANRQHTYGVSAQDDMYLAIINNLDAEEIAKQYAQRITFTEDNKFATWLIKGLRANAYTKLLGNIAFPFVKTPSNIVMQALEITPGVAQIDALGKLASKLADREKVIFADPRLRQEYLGRQAASALLMATAGGLYASGNLIGANANGDRRIANSVKIGGKWYNYQGWGAAGIALGITASTLEAVSLNKAKNVYGNGIDDNGLFKIASAAIAQMIDVTVFKSFEDMLSNIDNPEGVPNWIANQVAGRLPFAGLAGYLELQSDPKAKDVKDKDFLQAFSDAVASRVPGLENIVPDKRDLFGRTIDRSKAPRFASSQPMDDLQAEMQNIVRVTGRGFRMPDRKFLGRDITSREYERLVQVQGQLYRDPITGLNMEQAVALHMASDDYEAMNWDQKGEGVRAIISDYRSAANLEVRDPDSPLYMRGMVRRVGGERLNQDRQNFNDTYDALIKGRKYGLSDEDVMSVLDNATAFKGESSDDILDALND